MIKSNPGPLGLTIIKTLEPVCKNTQFGKDGKGGHAERSEISINMPAPSADRYGDPGADARRPRPLIHDSFSRYCSPDRLSRGRTTETRRHCRMMIRPRYPTDCGSTSSFRLAYSRAVPVVNVGWARCRISPTSHCWRRPSATIRLVAATAFQAAMRAGDALPPDLLIPSTSAFTPRFVARHAILVVRAVRSPRADCAHDAADQPPAPPPSSDPRPHRPPVDDPTRIRVTPAMPGGGPFLNPRAEVESVPRRSSQRAGTAKAHANTPGLRGCGRQSGPPAGIALLRLSLFRPGKYLA